MPKLSKETIVRIIKEEYRRAKVQTLTEGSVRERELGTLSQLEIQEMLENFFQKKGKIPDGLENLNTLFKVLRAAGLGNIVDSYMKVAKKEGKEVANDILTPVKLSIINIKNPHKIDEDHVSYRERKVIELMKKMTVGTVLTIPYTSRKLAKNKEGNIKKERLWWEVTDIENPEDILDSVVHLKHKVTGTTDSVTASELVGEYNAKINSWKNPLNEASEVEDAGKEEIAFKERPQDYMRYVLKQALRYKDANAMIAKQIQSMMQSMQSRDYNSAYEIAYRLMKGKDPDLHPLRVSLFPIYNRLEQLADVEPHKPQTSTASQFDPDTAATPKT